MWLQVLILDEENFPSLSTASSPAKPLSKRTAAAAATARPASPDTPLHTRADESTPGASRSASPAPIVPAERPGPAAEPEAGAVGEVDVQSTAQPAAEGSAASADEEVATAEAGPVTAGSAAPQTPEAAAATEAEALEEPSASGKDVLEVSESQGGAPAQPQLFAPPAPAWGRKEKPAFLLASDTDAAADGNTHAAQAAPVDAPKRAVPITTVRFLPLPLSIPLVLRTRELSQEPAPHMKVFGLGGFTECFALILFVLGLDHPNCQVNPLKECAGSCVQASVAHKGGRKGSAGGNTPWVATGAAADTQYTEARTIARDHMRLRNQFFQQVRPRCLAVYMYSGRATTIGAIAGH